MDTKELSELIKELMKDPTITELTVSPEGNLTVRRAQPAYAYPPIQLPWIQTPPVTVPVQPTLPVFPDIWYTIGDTAVGQSVSNDIKVDFTIQ